MVREIIIVLLLTFYDTIIENSTCAPFAKIQKNVKNPDTKIQNSVKNPDTKIQTEGINRAL